MDWRALFQQNPYGLPFDPDQLPPTPPQGAAPPMASLALLHSSFYNPNNLHLSQNQTSVDNGDNEDTAPQSNSNTTANNNKKRAHTALSTTAALSSPNNNNNKAPKPQPPTAYAHLPFPMEPSFAAGMPPPPASITPKQQQQQDCFATPIFLSAISSSSVKTKDD